MENENDPTVEELDTITKTVDWDEIQPEDGEIEEGDVKDAVGTRPAQKLRMAIIGDNEAARIYESAADPLTMDVKTWKTSSEDLGGVFQWRPNVICITEEIPLLANDTPDDSHFIAMMEQIFRGTPAGLLIRNTVTPETFDRIIQITGPEWFVGKIVYAPIMDDNYFSPYRMLGGHPKAVEALRDILNIDMFLGCDREADGTVYEVSIAHLGAIGFKALKQVYFKQLHDMAVDMGGCSPHRIRKLISQHPVMTELDSLIPIQVRAFKDPEMTPKKARSFLGEFENHAAKYLNGMTDRLTVLEEALNARNFNK